MVTLSLLVEGVNEVELTLLKSSESPPPSIDHSYVSSVFFSTERGDSSPRRISNSSIFHWIFTSFRCCAFPIPLPLSSPPSLWKYSESIYISLLIYMNTTDLFWNCPSPPFSSTSPFSRLFLRFASSIYPRGKVYSLFMRQYLIYVLSLSANGDTLFVVGGKNDDDPPKGPLNVYIREIHGSSTLYSLLLTLRYFVSISFFLVYFLPSFFL